MKLKQKFLISEENTFLSTFVFFFNTSADLGWLDLPCCQVPCTQEALVILQLAVLAEGSIVPRPPNWEESGNEMGPLGSSEGAARRFGKAVL